MTSEQLNDIDNNLSASPDNLKYSIDSDLELVSKYLVSSLDKYREREEQPSLSVILDKLKNLSWSECEKKTLYAAHKLKLTYRNELRRLYENTAEAFAGSINTLSKKGLIEIVEEGPECDLKMNYLIHNVKGMSKNSQEKIILCRLTPPAKAFFSNQKSEEFLEKEIGQFFSGKVCREAAKFNQVVKQVQAGKRKQAEEEQSKKEQTQLKNELSRKADELIIKYKNDFPKLMDEFGKLIQENPTQKPFLISKKNIIASVRNGKRITWETFVGQRERCLKTVINP